MPTSYHEAISTIVDLVVQELPESVLDLGVGYGKYGVLLREVLDIRYKRYQPEDWQTRIDGVEGFRQYWNPLHDYAYTTLHYGKIEAILDGLPTYDVVLMVDVIEHFTKPEGLKILGQVLNHTRKAVLIATPALPYPQGEVNGNALERHLSFWEPADFRPFQAEAAVVHIGREGALIARLRPKGAKGGSSQAFPPRFPVEQVRV